MLFAYKEVIMDRFRGQVSRAIDLSLTSDAKKPVVEWRFCCCDDNLDVYHGLLDLQLPTPSPAINEDTPPSHETAHMQMPNFIDQTELAFKHFATSCYSTRAGFPRVGTYQSSVGAMLNTTSYFFTDGAPEAQRDARLVLGSLPGDKLRHVDRDWLHELRIAVKAPLQAEPKLQDIREKMITGQSTPAKNVTFRPKTKLKWQACQQVLLKSEPQNCPLDTIISNLSYAPQRADSESTPWENVCSTVVATTMMIADESSDDTRKAHERTQSLETLKHCCSGEGWLTGALVGDWFVSARKFLLRPRDVAMPFAALDGRMARSWKQLTTEMFFNGKIASPEHNAGTLVAIVTKQLEKTRTIHCGKGDIHILGWPKDGDATLLKLMRCMQRVTSAAHKLVDAVIDPHIFGNSVECFDVVQWIDVLKAQRVAAARSTASETTDRLLGLYRKYCAGRCWEPSINSFRDLMLEAASAYIDQEAELERHGNKLGCQGMRLRYHTIICFPPGAF